MVCSVDWGSVADFLTCGIAVVAAFIALQQIKEGRRSADRNFAHESWRNYVELGLNNPDLGATDITFPEFDPMALRKALDNGSVLSERYLWFLTMLLDTCETIRSYSKSTAWTKTMSEQIGYHKRSLTLLWKAADDPWSGYYTTDIDKIVMSVLEPKKNIMKNPNS